MYNYNKIEISWNVEGEIKDKFIAPLLMLPFLENAFKHGTSEQIENPWLSVDIIVTHGTLKCKIANTKNEYVSQSAHGIGINNVKKRLEFIYPGKYDLKINDDADFFVVSMTLILANEQPVTIYSPEPLIISQKTLHEASLPADR